MQATQSGSRLDEIARKWHDLAQRRLDYYTELYRSGRWRHYYTQERFAVRMFDVIKATKTWGELAKQPQGKQPQAERDSRRDDLRPAA